MERQQCVLKGYIIGRDIDEGRGEESSKNDSREERKRVVGLKRKGWGIPPPHHHVHQLIVLSGIDKREREREVVKCGTRSACVWRAQHLISPPPTPYLKTHE